MGPQNVCRSKDNLFEPSLRFERVKIDVSLYAQGLKFIFDGGGHRLATTDHDRRALAKGLGNDRGVPFNQMLHIGERADP